MSYWHELERECVELRKNIAAFLEENDIQRASIQDLSGKVVKALIALRRVDLFITNGLEFGYIRMPDSDCGDSALEMPNIIKQTITELEGGTD